MKFNEKMQYKLRNFLYEQDRKKNYKTQTYKNPATNLGNEESNKTKFIQAIDEMDTYLGEKMKDVQLPKIKK